MTDEEKDEAVLVLMLIEVAATLCVEGGTEGKQTFTKLGGQVKKLMQG